MMHTIIDLLIWTLVFIITLMILLFSYKKHKTYIFINYGRRATYITLTIIVACIWLFGGLFILDSILHN